MNSDFINVLGKQIDEINNKIKGIKKKWVDASSILSYIGNVNSSVKYIWPVDSLYVYWGALCSGQLLYISSHIRWSHHFLSLMVSFTDFTRGHYKME